MALVDVLKGSFSAGELSPLAHARTDIDRYAHGGAQLENWQVLTQGGVRRRHGFRYIATVKHPTRLTLVKAFEPSTTDAYILEVGHEYLRFYKNMARIESPPGTPVEVATPYQEEDLRLLRTAQSNDVMLWVHGGYAPQRLSRLSDTSWDFRPITFDPPPTFVAGVQPAAALTLSATTGTITITAGASVFLGADAQRQITAGVGRAVITTVTSGTQVTAVVRDAFSSTSIASGAWTLTGSPVAECTPDMTGPVGAQVTLTLGGIQPAAPELVDNGDFATNDLTDWTNLSGPLVVAGAHDGGAASAALVDSTADFVTSGVQNTMLVDNETDGSQGIVAGVQATRVIAELIGGAVNVWNATDVYSIRGTGRASGATGAAVLTGGSAGTAWIYQDLTTVANQRYRVTWDGGGGPVAAQVGSVGGTADLFPERSFPLPTDDTPLALLFTASGVTSSLSFRNNQQGSVSVDNVSCKLYSLTGFRSTDVGNYVAIHDGLVRLTSVTNGFTAVGEIVKELSTAAPAPAGAWTLESPAWSDTLGWPSAVVLYEGRLYFAGTLRFPQTLWGSAVDDLFNFALGITDADAVRFAIIDSGGNITLNRIRWLMPAENMLVGTTHGEYRLVGSGDDPLTARLAPRVRIQSTYGSDVVQPLKVGAALLFAQRQGSKVREMVFDADTNTTFVARDITVLSEHLLRRARVQEFAYQQEPISTVWGVRSDGQGLGLTYDLSEKVLAWWRLVTAGSIESLATIPHPTANAHQLWGAIQRTINGSETRFIEVQDPEVEMVLPTPVEVVNPVSAEVELLEEWYGLTVDAGVVYSGSPTMTLTGLGHLEGETVQIVGDGAVFPTQVVNGGEVTIGQTVSTAFVGLGFSAKGRTLRPEIQGLRGTVQRSRKRWVELTAWLFESLCLLLRNERLPFRQPSHPQNQGPPPFSGDRKVQPLGWDVDGVVTFVADQPVPCTLVGIIGVLDVEAEQ